MFEWKTSPAPVPYQEALDFMDSRVAGIHKGEAPETGWLLEHPAMYTAGTSARAQDLLKTDLPVFTSGRGGQYTYHGPGQRIAYMMVDLKKRGQQPDIKQYVCDLQSWIIRTLKAFDIKGECHDGRVGVWVGDKKIAAIGVRVRRWITLHGISINVNPDLKHYEGIVPCGLWEYGVTSMHDLGVKAGMAELDKALKENAVRIFG